MPVALLARSGGGRAGRTGAMKHRTRVDKNFHATEGMNKYYSLRGARLSPEASYSDVSEFSTLAILRGDLMRGVVVFCDVSTTAGAAVM